VEAAGQEPQVSAWKLRAVVYGFVAVLAALVLVPRALSSDDGGGRSPVLIGRTSQGSIMSMRVDGDRVTSFHILSLRGRCSNGRIWGITWYPATDQANVRYKRSGRRFEIHEWPDRRFPGTPGVKVDVWMRATLSDDGRSAQGVAWYVADAGTVHCESGGVSFRVSNRP
jgi:hypothetical protein